EVPEEIMLEAIMFGHEEIKKLIAFQEEIVAAVGKEKIEVVLFELDAELTVAIKAACEADMNTAIQTVDKQERQDNITAVKERVIESYKAQEADENTMKHVHAILDKMVKDEVRRLITDDKIRPDGRKQDEIRPLSSETDLLPRVHGSAMFTRGQTQAVSITTLGPLGDVQIIDGLGVEETKRFMHHYNFPAFSVGETGRYGSPGRREIGHGALGERAILAVLPSEEDFPYAIRCVAEVIESNGSTSQASICASVMSLMAAGVPIKAPVAGIAMGLVKKGD
ncbi:MAG: polyribonucleotide nucleotidyltransferase, partial [Lysinibacillus sp.]